MVGKEEVFGHWLAKNKSASFWLGVLSDLKTRSNEDILVTAISNLKSFTEAMASAFRLSTKRTCINHQIRNACRFVVSMDIAEHTEPLIPGRRTT